MDIRIQQALDGEIAREDLTSQERARLAEAEALFKGIVRAVPVEPVPDLSQAVVSKLPKPAEVVRQSPLDLIRGVVALIWNPQPMRPAYALGAFAALAAVMLVRAPTSEPVVAAAVQTSQASQASQVFVQFRLDAPRAQQVALAGDFTGWKPAHKLTRSGTGAWTIVVPLTPGVHDYAFIVDGERWVADPMAPTVEDGFGGMNSRLALLTPDARML